MMRGALDPVTREGLVIVKIGGAAVDDPEAAAAVFKQVAMCRAEGLRVVVVHGGGARLTALATRLGLESKHVGGRRITDAPGLEAAKMAFAGTVATDLAAIGRQVGVPLVAISGVSGNLIHASKRPPRQGVDFGFVGDIVAIDPTVLVALLGAGFVPLVASLGADGRGQVLNINADTVACAIASVLPGCRLVILTETDGVLRDVADSGSRIPRLSAAGLGALGVSGGMLPKLESIASCLERGVAAVHVASWRQPRSLLASLAGDDSVGTVLTA
jgi:acetylglutamate kinase